VLPTPQGENLTEKQNCSSHSQGQTTQYINLVIKLDIFSSVDVI